MGVGWKRLSMLKYTHSAEKHNFLWFADWHTAPIGVVRHLKSLVKL